MSRMELVGKIQQELNENPALEEVRESVYLVSIWCQTLTGCCPNSY
jgi:hypothetical protein